MWTPLFLAAVLAVTSAVGQNRCCVDKTYSAIISDTDQVAKGNYQFSQLALDFDAKLLATATYRFSPGNSSTLLGRTIQDFNKLKQYDVYGNTCSVKNLNYNMQGPCIPDHAEYLGSNYMGLEPNSIKIRGYRWKFENQDAYIVLSVNDECIPLVESITGNLNGVDIDNTYTITMYNKTIPDQSIFSIPPICNSS